MSLRAPEGERLVIDGPAGPLDALLELPPGPPPARYAVICHPHPLFGGTLQNKVVYTLARAVRELGCAALRFNFRGVGRSAGAYDHGVGETADAMAVAAWGAVRFPGAALWSMGFSFGSFVACQVALQAGAARLVTVAPPVQRFDFSVLRVPSCPWLVVQGDADELVNHEAVMDWAHRLSPPPQVALLPGVDHFFHGRLTELRAVVQDFLRK